MRRLVGAVGAAVLLLAGLAPPAHASVDVVGMIATSGGRYVWAGASLTGADCSGLVSVAQSLAMGQEPHRIGDTHTLLAGQWFGAIPGAAPDDAFVIGVNPSHMVASVQGVNIEASTPGAPFKVGDDAASPWAPQYQQYHVDPALLGALLA